MWVAVMWLGLFGVGGAGSGTRSYPACINWLCGAHFLWQDTLLSFEIGGRDFVLPQFDISYFVDSPTEDVSPLRSWQG